MGGWNFDEILDRLSGGNTALFDGEPIDCVVLASECPHKLWNGRHKADDRYMPVTCSFFLCVCGSN